MADNILFSDSIIAPCPLADAIVTPSFGDTVIMTPHDTASITLAPPSTHTGKSIQSTPDSIQSKTNTDNILSSTNAMINTTNNATSISATTCTSSSSSPAATSSSATTTAPGDKDAHQNPNPTSTSNINYKRLVSFLQTQGKNRMSIVKKTPLKKKTYTNSDSSSSKLPSMNKMARFQLGRLLKARSRFLERNPNVKVNPEKPLAVMTVHCVTREPVARYFRPYHILREKIIYDKYMPIICDKLSGVIHLDKFFCPGINRCCIEFEDTFITPRLFVEQAGLSFRSDWRSLVMACNGRSLSTLMNTGQVKYTDHPIFCTGYC